MDIANVWLQSRLPASIRGARLLPIVHPRYENLAHREEGEQGEAYHLIQEKHKREWILKKFKPDKQLDRKYLVAIRSLVPRGAPCMAASKRLVLAPEDLKSGEDLYSSPELAKWLQDTILMPKVPGKSWNEVTAQIRKGTLSISLFHRLNFAMSLTGAVCALEDNGCAHRDLSQHNLFLDLQEYIVYLVDWDSLFHGSLYFHKNTPAGTEGYLAPWVKDTLGKWDARKSWNRKGDRFALAILITELLLVERDAPAYYDGALFSQEMYFDSHSYLLRARESLSALNEPLGDLFYQTLIATSYDECPSPVKWQEALSALEAIQEPQESPEGVQKEEVEDIAEEIVSSGGIETSPRAPRSFKGIHYLLIFLILAASVVLCEFYQRQKYNRSLISLLPLKKKTEQTSAEKGQIVPEQAHEGDNREVRDEDIEDIELAELEDLPETPEGEIPTAIVPSLQSPEGEKEVLRKYRLWVKYAGDDLKMNVDNKDIPLSKEHMTWLEIAPGEHTVTLTYTGLVKLASGDIAPDPTPIAQTRKIAFGDKSNIVFRIKRKSKEWVIED